MQQMFQNKTIIIIMMTKNKKSYRLLVWLHLADTFGYMSPGWTRQQPGWPSLVSRKTTIPELVLTVGPNTDYNVDSGDGPANLEAYLSYFFYFMFYFFIFFKESLSSHFPSARWTPAERGNWKKPRCLLAKKKNQSVVFAPALLQCREVRGGWRGIAEIIYKYIPPPSPFLPWQRWGVERLERAAGLTSSASFQVCYMTDWRNTAGDTVTLKKHYSIHKCTFKA